MGAAGLMNGFFKQGGSVNANDDIAPGMYQNPTNAPNSYGMLVVFRTSGVRLQFFINTDDKLYIRSMSVSGWTSWKLIA